MNGDSSADKPKWFKGGFLLLLLLLGGTLAVLCRQGFRPYQVFWANDLPLGALMESSSRLPGGIFGCWADFFWIGGPNVAFPPNLSNWCMALLSPEHHLKFYVPGSMLFLGFGAWFFFRQLRFAPMVCVLGGLGAGLNMHFFSNACWGLGQWNVCGAMIFIALGILVSSEIRPLWLQGVLAGLCTGMAVMEGFDVGAILSLYVGLFLAFLFLTSGERLSRRAGKTLLVGGWVVVSAVLISLSTIYTLVATQISGTGGGGQTRGGKEARWQFTTQWSIPKVETLRVIIPGLFGYRMQEYSTSTNKAGCYWGKVGEDTRIEGLESGDPQARTHAAASLGLEPHLQDLMGGDDRAVREGILDQVKAQVQRRHTGNGEYAGVLVCVLAAFALARACRMAGSPFSVQERRAVWFWGGAALFSLLAAWGRHGFVYPLIYHIPFLTNIRSPMKFMHPMNLSLIILSGYGLETLYRGYLSKPSDPSRSLFKRGFERQWLFGSTLVLMVAAMGFFIVQAQGPAIAHYVERNGFDTDLARQMARFCRDEVGRFVLYLLFSISVLICILSGVWAGRRAVVAWVFLCAIMICDLYRADAPWIRYYNYKEKLTMNPVVDLLRQKPWEHRVVSRLSPQGPYDIGTDADFGNLCHWWLENDYPFNDIQSLEIDQAPRPQSLETAYLGNFTYHSPDDLSPAAREWLSANTRQSPVWNWVLQSGPAARLWRLTNTRYIFGNAHLTDYLNYFAEPPNSFRTLMRMDIVDKPGVTQVEDSGDMTVKTNSDGAVALIEFTRVLPRAKLFAHWQVVEDSAALRMLDSPQFDPEKSVLVAGDTPVSLASGNAEANPGTVEISHYESKDLILQADAKTPAVLLLNDRTGSFWNVWIDQRPGTVLRCNYIMRGVQIPAGRHTIEFRYEPPRKMLYVSLAAFGTGILLGGYALITRLVRHPRDPLLPARSSSQPNLRAV